QPIVRLADGVVVGHEALLRWRHDQHGWLPPSEFLRVCEDSGLIEQVDWLLYRRVVEWMGRHPDGYVSINVSPRHFHAEDFADGPRAARTLGTLRANGVAALLDDFGTGFSALSYLHRFPIQALKIDQSFIAGLAGDTQTESLALVRAILALAVTLGIETIGEG